MGDGGQLRPRNAGLELAGIGLLEQQIGNQRAQIGIAAAFAQPVERALRLARAGADGGEGHGHGLFGVVVGMDAEIGLRQPGLDLRDDAIDLLRHGAAIGVAQDQPCRPCIRRRLDALQRVVGIGLVAIEEVFGIQQRLAAARHHRGDGFGDAVDIVLARDFQRDIDMEVPALGDEAGRTRLGIQHGRQARIVGGAAPGTLGHAEGGQPGMFQRRRIGEELRIGRVGARKAALDVVDAEAIERQRDLALVLDRKVDPLRLCAIAQRGVEQIEALFAHDTTPVTPARGPGASQRRSWPPARRHRTLR